MPREGGASSNRLAQSPNSAFHENRHGLLDHPLSRMMTVIRGRRRSLDLLVRINAPQLVLLDPAVKAVAGDLAPFSGAVFDRAQHADLQLRRHCAFGVGFGVDWR